MLMVVYMCMFMMLAAAVYIMKNAEANAVEEEDINKVGSNDDECEEDMNDVIDEVAASIRVSTAISALS